MVALASQKTGANERRTVNLIFLQKIVGSLKLTIFFVLKGVVENNTAPFFIFKKELL